RNVRKYSLQFRARARAQLAALVDAHLAYSLMQFVRALSEDMNQNVSRDFVQSIFQSWHWSWKRPVYQQRAKYTAYNMQRYAEFVQWRARIDPNRIVYTHEAHFAARKTRSNVLYYCADHVESKYPSRTRLSRRVKYSAGLQFDDICGNCLTGFRQIYQILLQ
ncbi:hypothetical protein PROFUN_13420, partial [Planoprotostelium fungivorum]